MPITRLFILALAVLTGPAIAAERWYPAQKPPRVVVRSMLAAPDAEFGTKWASAPAEHMLLQSVAGLAAQAVNDGRGDEMVWVDSSRRPDYDRWYAGMVKRLGVREGGPLSTLDLVRRYAQRGVIKGYVLYKADGVPPNLSKAERKKADSAADESVNVATTMAGLLGGVLVSEELEPTIKALGLAQLFDARGKTSAWCFREFQSQLNRSFVFSQKPRVAYMRDVAIAHRMLAFWDGEDGTLATPVYAWLHPLSSVIGWVGNEGEDVEEASRYGHVVFASDLSLNVPLLSAAIDGVVKPPLLKTFDPRTIDANDKRSAVSFIMSDGDNLQWAMGGFFGNEDYWASREHGRFPIGFGLPVTCLAQVCPEALDHAAATQPDGTTVVQASSYIFPDLFGASLPPAKRRELLARHARRLGATMGEPGVTTLVFICRDVNSAGAIEAYEIYAREIPSLAGMFVIQYAPYEAGDGRIHWVKSAAGVEIPVVTSKYSIWANSGRNRQAGGPGKVAELINAAAKTADAAGEPANFWAMTHAWSAFTRDVNSGEIADLPVGSHDGPRGVTPTGWCVDRLDPAHVRVVSPAELIWRIRLSHDARATQRVIAAQFSGK